MTEPTIDLDAILKPYIAKIELENSDYYHDAITPENAKKAMLQACKECLRVAADSASASIEHSRYRDLNDTRAVVNAQSILNVEKLIKL